MANHLDFGLSEKIHLFHLLSLKYILSEYRILNLQLFFASNCILASIAIVLEDSSQTAATLKVFCPFSLTALTICSLSLPFCSITGIYILIDIFHIGICCWTYSIYVLEYSSVL